MNAFLGLAPVVAFLLGQAEATPAPAAAEEAAAAAETPADPAATAEPAEAPAPASAPAAPAAARPAEPERTSVARTALAFLDALLAGDAAALAAASAERFSFDGDVRTGRDEVRRTWRTLLAARDPAARGELLDLEVLPAADAVARLGAPPPKLAALVAARGTWVAIANVSRRPVVLFVAREGGRWAVVGIE